MHQGKVIDVKDLRLTTGAHFTLWVPHFELYAGELTAVRGSNGSGKTTFLETLLGLRNFNSGIISIFSLKYLERGFYNKIVNNVYFLPQRNRVFEQLSVADNIQIFMNSLQTKEVLEEMVGKYVRKLKSTSILAGSLSKGERLRLNLISIERLLRKDIETPKLAIMDEPFAGLDHEGIDLVSNLLMQLKNTGWGLLISNHVSDLDRRISAKIWTIEEGPIGEYQMKGPH